MMNEESTFGGPSSRDQNNHSNSSQAYLQRAASAVEEGDVVLGIHLYLAAYERALRENHSPSQAVLDGMGKAWDLAISAKQRSLAEYIFEKLEPFWKSEEVEEHAEQLQQLAFDKLEEYGFDRAQIEDMTDLMNQDLMDLEDVLCRYEDSYEGHHGSSPFASHHGAHAAAGSADPSEADTCAEDAGEDATDATGVAGAAGATGTANEAVSAHPAGQAGAQADAALAAGGSVTEGTAKADATSEPDVYSALYAHPEDKHADAQSPASHKEAGSSAGKASHDGSAEESVHAEVLPSDSPLAAAFAQLTNMALNSAQESEQEASAPRFDYRNLVGFDRAIDQMAKLGVGRGNDPEFQRFIEMLNKRHGLPGMPGLGTLIFRSSAREDANCFMVATVGELGLPAIRMRLDRNAMGQVVLCVMASPNFKARLSGVSRTGFDSPTVVVLEDLDLWDLPFFDNSTEDPQAFMSIQLSRGAREALALLSAALTSPEATVLISASEPHDIDPFFWDLIGNHRIVDIDLPNDAERRAIWRSEQAQHPSLRGLNMRQLVEYSRTLSRFEIYAISNEAVEEAYRESVAQNRFCAVPTDAVLMRLSNFQPLDSKEYQELEDLAVERFRKELSDFDDLLED